MLVEYGVPQRTGSRLSAALLFRLAARTDLIRPVITAVSKFTLIKNVKAGQIVEMKTKFQ